MKRRPTVCYYSRSGRDCVYWLGAAVVFGGAPVAVYFSAADAKPFNLVLGAILGGSCLAVSLWCLGRTTFLALHTDERMLVFGRSLYSRRGAEAVEFQLVERVEWRHHVVGNSQWNEIHVCLKETRRLVLAQSEGRLLEFRARKIADLIGVPAVQGAGTLRS